MTFRQALLILAVVSAGGLALTLGGGYGFPAAGMGSPTTPPAETAPSSEAEADKIIAYYFHVTVRCQTCLAIETYSEEAIKQEFASEIAAGKIEWRSVNVQLPENRHFVKEYKLFTRSLVYVLTKNGEQVKYKVLDRTWQLVGNEKWLKNYVKKEMDKYLRRLE